LPEIGYDTTSTAGGGSITRDVADPLGSGLLTSYRELPADGGVSERAEDFVEGYNSPYLSRLYPGEAIWYAGGLHIRPGLGRTRGGGSDNEVVAVQTHTQATGDTQPDIVLQMRGQGTPDMYWQVSYNEHPPEQWDYNWVSGPGPYSDTTATTTVHSETLITAGQRYLWIVRVVPAWQVSDNPSLDIWRSIDGAAFSQIVTNYTGLNTYNVTGWGVEPSYSRQGPYKYGGSAAEPNPLGFYYLPYYFGKESEGWGYANAEAALVPWM
jgi:hypothetical protein